ASGGGTKRSRAFSDPGRSGSRQESPVLRGTSCPTAEAAEIRNRPSANKQRVGLDRRITRRDDQTSMSCVALLRWLVYTSLPPMRANRATDTHRPLNMQVHWASCSSYS